MPDDVTPRTPGLDPERVEAATEDLARFARLARFGGRDYTVEQETRSLLAADDAHARSRGLVATGDAVPVEAVRRLVAFVRDFAEDPMCDCSPGEPDVRRCESCRATDLLAALPSSLLDNPEADR